MASLLNVKSILTSLFLASALLAKASAAPPPIEHFTKPEQIQPYSLELSPSGQYYALIAPRDDRSSLIIVDRATNKVNIFYCHCHLKKRSTLIFISLWKFSQKLIIVT